LIFIIKRDGRGKGQNVRKRLALRCPIFSQVFHFSSIALKSPDLLALIIDSPFFLFNDESLLFFTISISFNQLIFSLPGD
jgi:hypothetical protein